jgi:hypothetical protein
MTVENVSGFTPGLVSKISQRIYARRTGMPLEYVKAADGQMYADEAREYLKASGIETVLRNLIDHARAHGLDEAGGPVAAATQLLTKIGGEA